MPPTLFPALRQTVAVCGRCSHLFTDPQSVTRLANDDPVLHGRVSDLSPNCSLCSLLRKGILLAASSTETEQNAVVEDRELSLLLMFQDDDNIDDEDVSGPGADGYLSGIPSTLFCFLEGGLTTELDLHRIPEPVLELLGLDVAGNDAIHDWHALQGFYTSENYWAELSFTQSIMEMITECRSNHSSCGGKCSMPLPSMILDVTTASSQGRITLCRPTDQQPHDYVALSYCWGGPQPVVTTKAKLGEYLQLGLEVACLPRTIAEAVRVTASLGIKYLWVDALCIVQDDDMAKAIEIEKMGDIYSNAALVLLAGGATRAANDGFLQPWHEIAIVPVRTAAKAPIAHAALALSRHEADYINSRGWTFQERFLAARTLEFRGSRGVSLSCMESFMSFTGGAAADGSDTWLPNQQELAEKLSVSSTRRGEWHNRLADYSLRNLTNPEDRLPALAGFARVWNAQSASASSSLPPLPDEYLAGMWKSQIVDDLMWRSGVAHMGGRVKIDLHYYREPGWSWVSVLDHDGSELLKSASFITNDQRVRLAFGGRDEDTASYVRHRITLAHADAPFGRVTSGTITLRAQVAPVRGPLEDDQEAQDYEEARREHILAGCNYDISSEQTNRLLMLRLKTALRWDTNGQRGVERGEGGLLILPQEGRDDLSACKRLGCFWDWSDVEEGRPLVDWDEVAFHEVTLI